MSDSNKSYRIRTVVGQDTNLTVNLDQSYDVFEVLSIKLKQEDTYRLHASNYGVIVGRVLANEGFGVPNAKVSVFIKGEYDASSNTDIAAIYPYQTTSSQGMDGVQYNLLPDNQVDDCHQVVGTFPNKTYMLDNDALIEVFDEYYKYTTRTNNSGDYIICGVPVGQQTLHMDLDLSDCGILSQRPRDFVYKGYTIEQFENPNQFKNGTDLNSLSQIFRQDTVVNVIPFWGNEELGETIGITRADINVNFKFEPTCVFMGSLVADNSSNGVSKKCVPTNQMGAMDELTTGEGTIEMIRKTPNGDVEEFQIKGTQLIDGNGVWCYQIPMNLDYMMTDEYGNMVPTDDPTKGIPTRARVRFRISMHDTEKNTDNYFRAKVLVPHNPQNYFSGETLMHEDYDYEFGTYTKEESFRDLFWNNVYTVKSYIPRFQKSRLSKSERFTGIKHCNIYGQNNPMPYNNIRIKLPLIFTLICVLIKTYVWITGLVNGFISLAGNALADLGNEGLYWPKQDILFIKKGWINWFPFVGLYKTATNFHLTTITEGICPDLENWYFAPIKPRSAYWSNFADSQRIPPGQKPYNILQQTFEYLEGTTSNNPNNPEAIDVSIDSNSMDESNRPDERTVCVTINTDYLISCLEMNLAQEYKVINFDFYNDWVNGVIYMPRWMKFVRKKRTYLFGLIKIKPKIKACMDDSKVFGKTRYYTQQCALAYSKVSGKYTKIDGHNGCMKNNKSKSQNCHKNNGLKRYTIFGSGSKKNTKGNGGAVHEKETMLNQFVYYFKPCEWRMTDGKKTILFANDIVLLGSLNDCNLYGIPQAFKYLTSSSYIMPTNLALTNMDDDSYLYADEDGTFCSPNKSINETSDEQTLHQLDTTFSATSKYYSTSPNENVTYGNADDPEVLNYDDTIPLTEAAGISWNYTGPGQGTPSRDVTKSIYYPGGHFLGLSCVNSMTNIKSCVNLQRICEAGSTMSQRREEVKRVSYTSSNGESDIRYKYFVPTGLVAQDDINGKDFRSMFATMNQNRLLCNGKLDEKTGYPIYDFVYMRPNGFDGSLKDRIAKDSSYNTGVTITDESTWMKKVGVTDSEDYDKDEKTNTETRTIEDTSEDYYMFRLGLNSLDDKEQKSRFLADSGSKVALPQYENSFYFYFGLKDGSSALDEFNKQFFSTCKSKSIFMNMPSITAKEVFDSCDLTFKLKITIENMTSPATLTIKNRTQNQTYLVGQGLNGKTTMKFTYPDDVNTGDVPPLALTIGTYEIEVTDSENQTATETVSVGLNSVRINTETKEFEFKTNNLESDEIIKNAKDSNCGYIKYEDNILVWDEEAKTYLPKNISEDEWGLIIVDNEGNYAKTINYVIPDVCTGTTDYTSVSSIDDKFYLWKADEEYDLYLVHICNGQYYSVYYTTYKIGGIDNYDLYLGSKYLPYSTKLKSLTGEWWNNVGSDDVDDRNWAIRHALFRQTDDDAELFTNAVIALDNNGKIIDTALFGEPEIYNSETGKYKPEGRVYYEGDTDYFGGDLSDDSILSTWGYLDEDELVDPTRKREQFGEMAMYNGIVASDKLCDMVGTFEEDGNAIKIVPIPPEEIPSQISDGQGCIVKLNDGTIIYPVNRGGYLYYYGELPEQTEQQISIYPTFIFPVMYKPFYGQMNVVDWVGSRLIMDYNGTEEIPTVSNDLEWYVSRLNVFNGITYNGNFDETSASSICNRKIYSDTGIVKSGDSNDLDGGESRSTLRIFDCSAKTETIDMMGFSVKEGSPLSSLSQESDEYKKLSTPNKVSLATIDCMSSLDMPSYINYKYDETGTDIIFISDNNGSSADFYLCNGKCPIEARGAVGMKAKLNNLILISNSGYVLGKYNQNAYNKSTKNIVGEDVFVQIYVLIILGVTNVIIRVPMFTSDDADTQVTVETGVTNYKITAEGATTIEKLLNQMTIGDSIYNVAYELGVTLEYNYAQNGLIYEATSAYTNIDETTSFVKKKINLGVANETSVENGNYIIGITTEPSGKKGFLKVARIYPNIKQISPYVPPSEDIVTIVPNAEDGVNPSAKENSGTTFISEGGELQVRIKAVGSWTFTLDGNSWLRIKDGSNLVTSITGSGSQYITVKAEENTTTEDRMVTGTAVSNADKSISAYTVFLSIQKTVKNYIEPVTITTFARSGGELGVRVVSNRDEAWVLKITNSSADDWVKFSDGSMEMTGKGNYTAYLIAEPNDGQNNRSVTVSIEEPEGGKDRLTFIQNAAQIELEVIPLALSFDKNGGTQYLSVRCNGEWTSSKNAGATWLTLENGTDTIKVIAATSNEAPRTAQITVKSPPTSDKPVERVVTVSQSDGVPKYIDTTFSVTAVTCEEQNNVVITVDSNTDWKLVKDNDVNWFKFPDDLTYVAGSGKASITCSVDKNYWEERTCTIQTKATLLDCIPNPETTVFYQGESEYEFQVQNATKFIIKSINYTTTDGGTLNYSDMYIYSWDWKYLKIFDSQYNCSRVSVTLTGEDLTGTNSINFMGLTLWKNEYGNFVGLGNFNVRHGDVYVLTL